METFKTKRTYYNDPHQTKNGSNSFWNILLVLCAILILIIIFIFCYCYVYGKIIYIYTRCFTWRNKKNDDDNFSITKGGSNFLKRRLLWLKFNREKDKLDETKSYKRRTPVQEKKKLLSSRKDKIITSNNNVDMTKKLFLKLSILSCPTNNKDARNQTSANWNIQNLKKYTSNELRTQKVKNYHQNLQKDEKSICFSDTDLKFLVIPVSSKKSNLMDKNRNEKILLCKWNSENISDYSMRNNTSSKLIELQCENKNSFSDDKQKYGVSTSKSNCSPSSFLLKNLTTDSFSDSAANRSDIIPNLFLKKLKRSTNSYTSSTISGASNATEIKSEDSFMHVTNNTTAPKIEELQKINVHPKKMKEKMKSSVDVLSQIKEKKNLERKVKSDENLKVLSIKNENTNNHLIFNKDCISIPEKYIESPSTPLNHSSEKSEIYDELGMLISQYMKLQTKPCRRKYCSRTRCLKQIQHTIRKCQIRFNNHQIYPYDQRPTCNSGNICVDTYDELKLMYAIPSERKYIYQHIFKRRKQLLNQPCMLINQEPL